MDTLKMLLSVFQWIKFIFFVQRLKKAVQKAVSNISDFNEGAIQFLFVPKCAGADRMMFGIGQDCERKFIFPARPGFGHTRPANFRDRNEEECDCSGYAALKIQGAAYAVKHCLGNKSEDMPRDKITWGRENDPGCICYTIYNHGGDYARIYVSVSGADSEEDRDCAAAAKPVILDWSRKNNLHW